MLQRIRSNQKGFTLIELMIVIAIIGILAAIAIPNFISYRNKSYCSEAESDANAIAGAIADYFSIATHTSVPHVGDLGINITNNATIQGTDPNATITVIVSDRTTRCPSDYQAANDMWTGDAFTKYIR